MSPASTDVGDAQATPAGVYGHRGLAVRCFFEGRDAGVAGLFYRACPYDARRPYSLRWWLRGYVTGRRLAGLPLPGDEDDT